jgi:ferredoxin
MAFVNRSTVNLIKEEGFLGFFKGRTIHGYIYLRWINGYVKLAINHLIPHSPRCVLTYLQNRYHAKVLTEVEAEAMITVKETIDLHDVPDQMVPYPLVRDIVIKQPHAIAVIDCACRKAHRKHCEPTQVCMIIGQPFVDFVMDQNPSARRLTEQEALALLKAEHERGHVHCAWFKDACLGRFYAICNCCKCCCSGVKAMEEFGTPIVASSGYVAVHDDTDCVGHGDCERTCLYEGIRVVDGKARVDWENCRGCGLCVDRCPHGALTLVRDSGKGIPLDVRIIAADRKRALGQEPEKDAWARIKKKLGIPDRIEPPQPPTRS